MTTALTNPWGSGALVAIINGMPIYAWPGETVIVPVAELIR